jgi:antitoxin (DNA-binding transcriptional repressor) of toxin-antitoxin stability system
MQTIDISELTPKAQELLSKIESGEEIVITADNKPIANIIPVNGQIIPKRKRRRAGTAKGTFWMAPDFNEPLEDFKEYMG